MKSYTPKKRDARPVFGKKFILSYNLFLRDGKVQIPKPASTAGKPSTKSLNLKV